MRNLYSRSLTAGFALLLGCFASQPLRAEVVSLQYEQAPAASGPWTTVPPGDLRVFGDGSVRVLTPGPSQFFRLRIGREGQGSVLPALSLEQVPRQVLANAQRHLDAVAQGAEGDADWENVRFAPFALPVADPAGGAGYVELKLIAVPPTNPPPRGFRTHDSTDDDCNRGSILCSLDRNDLPVLEYKTSGASIVEKLLQKCGGQTPARIVRFGPSFWVAEDERGRVLANHGTEPFKIPHAQTNDLDRVFSGEINTDTEQEQLPPRSPVRPEHYRDYDELKADFATGPVHRLLRERRSEHARLQWAVEEGDLPPVITLRVGERQVLQPTLPVTRFTLHDEDNRSRLADLSINPSGGLLALGVSEGSAPLVMRSGDRLFHFVLEVLGAGAAPRGPKGDENPKWKTVVNATAGAGWADQMHWYQLKRSKYCALVGCGPTAVGMLVGYWDRKGVVSAFYTSTSSFNSISTSDAPQEMVSNSEIAKVDLAYEYLHDYCDVICNPFGDDGATMPGDLIEGFADYMRNVASPIGAASLRFAPAGQRLVGYSSSWAYDWWGDDWDSSGSRVANGIKAGRPGVIGLGVLWHYAVAYAYKRQDLILTSGNKETRLATKRFFKCNEGWKNNDPSWYSAYDVFLGLTANIWQQSTPHP